MFPRLQPQLLRTSLAQGFAPQWLQGKVLAKINLFSHACQRYRLVQLVYGRVRVCVKLQCRGPGGHCDLASAHYFHLCCAAGGFLWPMLIFLCQITVPLPGHWKSHTRSSSISGYLFFFFRMPSVSRATDLEKAPVLSLVRRTFWPFLSIVLESAESFNKLRHLAQMPPCKGYPAQWPLHLLQAPLSNSCRSRKRGPAPAPAREPENSAPRRPRREKASMSIFQRARTWSQTTLKNWNCAV